MTTETPANAGTEAGVDPLALERQVCFALAVAARNVIGVYRPILERLDLTHPQYLVMLALWERSPLTVTEIGRLLQLDLPTLSPLLKRLEALGHVDRRRNPADERSLQVSLTESGRALREEALKVPGAVMEQLELTEDDVVSLHAALVPLITRSRAALASRTGGSRL
ncbi:MarR family winged helix-turn-helix transcriptional regulator [Microlunatus flavus]|uniref:DNA-binding transcriptional regulator, MarR family n=1 Tax=Microlunatus flavus TaxID=1036181 RepID=A0A1H8ZDU4_9ACTN|nr:MarR family transcriptional regulator [Microlunatus flavus]SEP62589.1 DNA-binding transcriptional regulator, MarR family [Microlunatus flavus]